MLIAILVISFLPLSTATEATAKRFLRENINDADLEEQERWLFQWGSGDETLQEPEPCYSKLPLK